jgi:hypothetical protein
MSLVVYLTSVVFIGALGVWIYNLVEQRVQDVQTIFRLRARNRELNIKIEELEREITMLKVF